MILCGTSYVYKTCILHHDSIYIMIVSFILYKYKMSKYSVHITQNSHVNNIMLIGDMREHLGSEVRLAS